MEEEAQAPRLSAKAGGRITQFVLATVPMFVLFVWLLYVSWERPRRPLYNLNGDDDRAIEYAYWESGGSWIPLIDILRIFVVFEGLWLLLLWYMWLFVPRRRALMKNYLTNGKRHVGNLSYTHNPNCLDYCMVGGKKYGIIEYRFPESTKEWWIRKQVRVYQHYSRENEGLVFLPGKPYSAQPKKDVEFDHDASSGTRSKTKWLAYLAIFWSLFCFAAAWYVYGQERKIYGLFADDFEQIDKAYNWMIFGACLICPVGSYAYISIRWLFYRHWVVNRGKLMRGEATIDLESVGPDHMPEEQKPENRLWTSLWSPSAMDMDNEDDITKDYEMPERHVSGHYRQMK